MIGDPKRQIEAMIRWAKKPDGVFFAACVRPRPDLVADIDLAFDDTTPVEAIMHLACALLTIAIDQYDEPQAAHPGSARGPAAAARRSSNTYKAGAPTDG